MKKSVTPKAKISIYLPSYSSLLLISGALNIPDPRLSVSFSLSVISIAKPKSDNFRLKFLSNRKFSGFISLWQILFKCRHFNPILYCHKLFLP